MTQKEFTLEIGLSLQHIVRALSDEQLVDLDDDLKIVENALIECVQLKFGKDKNNG